MKENQAPQFPARPRTELCYKLLMFTAAITGMALLSSFYPIYGNVPFIVIPSVLTILFAKPVFFEKMKLTTLVVMRLLVVAAALRLFDPNIYVDLILVALIVNILEATFTDLFRYKKIWNGISGLALALGVFALHGAWIPDGSAPFGMDYYLVGGPGAVTVLYIIGYTLWNWIFVTDEFSPSVSLMHVGFLSAPIIGCICTLGMGPMGGFTMWLLLRACTLSIGGWLQIGIKGWFEKEFYSENMAKFIDFVHTTPVQVVCMIINVGLMAAALLIAFQQGTLGTTFMHLFG